MRNNSVCMHNSLAYIFFVFWGFLREKTGEILSLTRFCCMI